MDIFSYPSRSVWSFPGAFAPHLEGGLKVLVVLVVSQIVVLRTPASELSEDPINFSSFPSAIPPGDWEPGICTFP